jgi:hypothetical protein
MVIRTGDILAPPDQVTTAAGGLKVPVILAVGVLQDLELRFSRYDRLPGGSGRCWPAP